MAVIITMKELLEAGVHFGHQSERWDPKMKEYIYSARNGIHVIDLHKSIPLIEKAYEFVKESVKNNGSVLFVGTKKQAQEAIEEEAKRCGMFYIKEKWLGGTLTNFKTLKKNIARLKEIEKMEQEGLFEKLPRKEVMNLKREHRKLQKGLGGIREMINLPSVVFIVDTKKEQIAVREAKKLEIPTIGIVDTNCDPNEVDFPIPGNDDAIKSVKLLCTVMADAVIEGREATKPVEERGEEIAVPLEAEEAKALKEEERLEDLTMADIKEFEKEKEKEEERIGF